VTCAVHVKIKVFIVHLLVGTVDDDRLQRSIECVTQGDILFTQPNAVTDTEIFAVTEFGTDKGKVFSCWGVEKTHWH